LSGLDGASGRLPIGGGDDLRELRFDAGGEVFRVDDRSRVDVDPDATRVDVREQRDVDRGTGWWCEPVHPLDLGTSQPGAARGARHVGGDEVDPLQHRAEQRRGDLAREVSEHAREDVGHPDRWLVAPAAGQVAQHSHPLDGISDRGRHDEASRGEAVATGLVAGTPGADGHRDPQLVDREPVVLVVPAQATDERGQERVVERPPGDVGRSGEVGPGDVDHREVAVEPALGGDRAQRVPRGCEHLADGSGDTGRGGDRVGRMGRDRSCARHSGSQHTFRPAVPRRWAGGSRCEPVGCVPRGRFGQRVGEDRQQRHASQSIRDGVVELEHERSATALHTIDDRHPPQRAGGIERVAGRRTGQVEHLAHRAWCGEADVT
jgi:hypothetical protein